MALPAIGSILAGHDDTHLWCHGRVSGLMDVFYPDTGVCTGSRVSGVVHEHLLLMTGSFRSALQGLLSGIPRRTGYAGDFRSMLLTSPLSPPRDRTRHHSLDYMDLADAIGCGGKVQLPKPVVEPSGEPHVALFPGARYGTAKIWGGFEELASVLAGRTGLEVIMYGPPGERAYLGSLARGKRGCRVRTDLSIPGLASVLMNAAVTAGNDSGGVHLSAALGVPTVTVFGSTSPAWTAPLGPLTVNLASSRDCSPCFRRVCPRGHAECLDDITLEMVADACEDLMDRGRDQCHV